MEDQTKTDNVEIIQTDDFKSKCKINWDKKVITIPLSFSVLIKKITWTEENKSVKLYMTCISRVSQRGFDDIFDMNNQDAIFELIEDIEEVNFRVNDEIIDDFYSRDAFGELIITDSGKEPNKDAISEGISQVSRLILDNIPIEVTDSNQRMFPIDNAYIKL